MHYYAMLRMKGIGQILNNRKLLCVLKKYVLFRKKKCFKQQLLNMQKIE